MSRLAATFRRLAQANRKALIPFVTAGFPDADATVPLMRAMVAGGADIIELGVPFSDPMADGPTVQRASEQALRSGMSLKRTLAQVAAFRQQDTNTPVVLMGYTNPVEAFGYASFVESAAAAGVDGILTVDSPPETCQAFIALLKAAKIDPIFLLAPTSSAARIEQVRQIGSGYVYYVSLAGVTGAAHLSVDAVAMRVPEIRAATELPVAVGFGIRDAESAGRIAIVADAVVVGSRIIEELEREPPADAIDRVRALLASFREHIDVSVNDSTDLMR